MELNIDWLIENKLTPNKYYFLLSIKNKNYEEALKQDWITSDNRFELVQAGYLLDPRKYDMIIPEERIITLQISQKFLDLIKIDTNQLYAEFCATFPIKVPGRSLGSYRYLHIKGEAIEKKYNSIVAGSLEKHKQIIQGLQKELEVRKQGNSLQFMNNMETWLNRRVWETYLEKEKEVKSGSKKFKLAE